MCLCVLLVAVLRIKIRVVKNLYWLVTWSLVGQLELTKKTAVSVSLVKFIS